MKFTKEEINLCKQVVKKHRKEIKEGDWVVHVDSGHPTLVRDKESIPYLNNEFQLPLWTISDCLEFLREKGFYLSINTLGEYWTCLVYKHIFDEEDKNIGPRIFFQEKTPLEACLKAVLAVLGEKDE